MTKDCCQVCVLPLRLPDVCMVSGNLNTTWFDTDFTPTGHGATYGKWYEKNSLHLIFTFYLNSDTSAPELFPVVVLKKKKIPLVDPFTFLLAMNRNRLELSDCGRKIRNDIHTDTYYCKPNSYHDDNSTQQCFTRVFCPQLIGNMRSRRHIDSSSIIAHR